MGLLIPREGHAPNQAIRGPQGGPGIVSSQVMGRGAESIHLRTDTSEKRVTPFYASLSLPIWFQTVALPRRAHGLPVGTKVQECWKSGLGTVVPGSTATWLALFVASDL